jgi:Domain of unknown function (DUF222)
MSTVMTPANMNEAFTMLQSAVSFMAAADAADLPAPVLAEGLHTLEQADATGAAARGRFLEAFDARDVHVADGQRTARTWLVHATRVTKGQAGEHRAVQALARDHPVLAAALAEGWVLTKSAALQLAKWTRPIPAEFRDQAEEIVVAAARAGADLRALAAICAEIRYRIAPPDPEDENDRHLNRGVSFDTTFEGAGMIRGDLTPECAAMVQAVLDALSAPQGGGDLRTRPQRYHDALEEAMRRLLASDLLPKRAGQPVKALVHVSFADLCAMDEDSALQNQWIAGYRARWAAHRAAASVSTGDGGAWLDGEQARTIACEAMVIPVVTGDIDAGAVEDLIGLCVRYHRLRTETPTASHDGIGACKLAAVSGSSGADAGNDPAIPPGLTGTAARRVDLAATMAETLAELETQILGKILQVVSGPGGVASFLRRQLLDKGLNGPSLPLDVGQTDEIPIHLRRLVALRDQTCQYPGGCDQPASGCEPHHVTHRKDGGSTSLTNLKDYCWWHHHVVLHELGWTLTAHPDGTSQVTSPTGKTIRSHSPPPRPG